jgi:hypothetical protein
MYVQSACLYDMNCAFDNDQQGNTQVINKAVSHTRVCILADPLCSTSKTPLKYGQARRAGFEKSSTQLC